MWGLAQQKHTGSVVWNISCYWLQCCQIWLIHSRMNEGRRIFRERSLDPYLTQGSIDPFCSCECLPVFLRDIECVHAHGITITSFTITVLFCIAVCLCVCAHSQAYSIVLVCPETGTETFGLLLQCITTKANCIKKEEAYGCTIWRKCEPATAGKRADKSHREYYSQWLFI